MRKQIYIFRLLYKILLRPKSKRSHHISHRIAGSCCSKPFLFGANPFNTLPPTTYMIYLHFYIFKMKVSRRFVLHFVQFITIIQTIMNFSITSNYLFKTITNYASSSSFKKASIAPHPYLHVVYYCLSRRHSALFENFRFGVSNVKIDHIITVDALHANCKRLGGMKCERHQSSHRLAASIL